MAKSLYEINLNYTEAINQAVQLSNISKEMRRLAEQDFQNTLQQISSNWKGESATAYIKKGEALKAKIFRSANDLEKIAKAICRIAERTKKADINARNIALSSGGGSGGGGGGFR